MSCHFCRARAPFYALRGVRGSLGAEIPAGFYGVAETRSPAEGSAARAACLVGAVMQANRVLYAANVVRGWRALHSPHEFAKSRLRRLLAGCPLRWVSQFSITSIPTKMLALRPLYANGEKYYAVRRNLSKNDNAICGILLYNKAISENLVV